MSTRPKLKYIVRFFVRAALVVLALLILRAMWLPGVVDISSPEGRAVRESIRPINPGDVPALIGSHHGKPTMVFIYASWCQYCRKLMPEIKEMLREGEFRSFNLLFLSLDTQYTALVSYLLQSQNQGLYTPYAITRGGSADVVDIIQKQGFNFTGGIPYTAFLDERGKIVAQHSGFVDKPTLIKSARAAGASLGAVAPLP